MVQWEKELWTQDPLGMIVWVNPTSTQFRLAKALCSSLYKWHMDPTYTTCLLLTVRDFSAGTWRVMSWGPMKHSRMCSLRVWRVKPVEKSFEQSSLGKKGLFPIFFFPLERWSWDIFHIPLWGTPGDLLPITMIKWKMHFFFFLLSLLPYFVPLPSGSHTWMKCLHLSLCFSSGFWGLELRYGSSGGCQYPCRVF